MADRHLSPRTDRISSTWAVFPPTEGSDVFAVCVNSPTGWRELLADWLRRLAGRIDGHWSLGVAMHANPPLPSYAQRKVIEAGIEAMVAEARGQCFPGGMGRHDG